MNKKITWCLALIVILFAGCKEDPVKTFNKNGIDLVVMKPVVKDTLGFFGTANSLKYALRGAIVSPAALDMSEYGFLVTEQNGDTIFVKAQAAKKAGGIELEYITSTVLQQSDLVLYAILKSGEILRSDDITNISNFPPTSSFDPHFEMVNFNVVPDIGNDLFLNANFYFNSSQYTITKYILYYEQGTAITAPNNWSLPLSSSISSYPAGTTLSIGKGLPWTFQLHVELTPIAGGQVFNFDSTPTTQSY